MTTIPELTQRALQHISFLAGKIGPRPAGSEAERSTLDYLEKNLKEWLYEIERRPVAFAPPPLVMPVFLAGGILLAAAGGSINHLPILALVTPLLLAILPELARRYIAGLPLARQSENLIAYTPALSERPTLILCAHVDSAPAGAIRNPAFLSLRSQTFYLAQRIAIAAAMLAFLRLLGFSLPPLVLAVMNFMTILAGGGWLAMELYQQLHRPVRYSPGANDNASGVSVLLALAEHYAGNPPAHIRLGFLFSGAEETGMHGASAFAAGLAPRAEIAVLNLDMVGCGNTLRYIDRDGTLFPLKTDQNLNALLRKAEPGIKSLWYTLRSGDHRPFLQNNIPAAALQVSGPQETELRYHTLEDTGEYIETSALRMTLRAVLNLIEGYQGCTRLGKDSS